MGKRVQLPRPGSRRQSAVSDVGSGIPAVNVCWVLTMLLVHAVTGLAGFRLRWNTILGTGWFLVGWRTGKPRHLVAV